MLAYVNPYSQCQWTDFIKVFFSRLFSFFSGGALYSDEVQVIVLSLIACSSAIVGVFLIYRKMTMLANALSHSVLFGIVITYLLMRSSFVRVDQSLNFTMMLIAALVTGFVTAFLSELIVKISRLQKDAAIGLVFTTLFALGVLLISLCSRNAHIGIELVLGNVDALHPRDILNSGLMLTMNGLLLVLFFGGLKLTTFDPIYAHLNGASVPFYNYLVIFMLSMTSIGSFRAVGVVLVLSFLIVPPLIAKMYATSLKKQISLAMFIGLLSALMGVSISRHLLTQYRMALSTAGVTVLTLYSLFFISWGTLEATSWLRRFNLLPKRKSKAVDAV